MIGLLPCAGIASRLSNIPKFILPTRHSNSSLITKWCKIMIDNQCDYIIIGSSVTNKPFIEYIINTQLLDHKDKIKIKLINNSITMNDTILQMLENENYDIALMGMPDTQIDGISQILIEKLKTNDNIAGAYLWKLRKDQFGKMGQCSIEEDYINDIIDKNKDCKYEHGWGSIIFKKEFVKYIKKEDLHLGFSLKFSIDNREKVYYEIMGGLYWDCGTIDEYANCLNYIKDD